MTDTYLAKVYGYFNKITGKCVYIGIDASELAMDDERHATHIRPSNKKMSAINTWLQERIEDTDWTYHVLEEIKIPKHNFLDNKVIAKKIVHAYEDLYVEKFKPKLNAYKK